MAQCLKYAYIEANGANGSNTAKLTYASNPVLKNHMRREFLARADQTEEEDTTKAFYMTPVPNACFLQPFQHLCLLCSLPRGQDLRLQDSKGCHRGKPTYTHIHNMFFEEAYMIFFSRGSVAVCFDVRCFVPVQV